jgi:hypothetical protein
VSSVRLAIDGVIALDIDLQGERSSSSVDIRPAGTVWAVVDVQSKRERGDVSIHDTQPPWG